jgi:uncharacterized membrane protein YhaH (DUF805 family)
MRWYWQALKKFATVSGRASRKEYWNFQLYNYAIAILLVMTESYLRKQPPNGDSVLANVYGLALLAPSAAVGSRRMHDAGHSGWWYVIPVVNVVFALQDGDHRDNWYGADPMLPER